MSKNTCPIEPLISSKYCQLSVCMECNIVNLSLPGKISFQFEALQFMEIAETFYNAAQILKEKKSLGQEDTPHLKLNQLH